MALKSFKNLSTRDKGFLIGQFYKLINYYNEFFTPRTRGYLREISEIDGSMYWLQGDHKKLIAAALVDPNYRININDLEIVTLSHTISTRPGAIHRILEHIFNDHKDSNLLCVCRPIVSESIGLLKQGFKAFSPEELEEHWPDLAKHKSSFYNTSSEDLVHGLRRKKQHAFLLIRDKHKETIKEKLPKLFKKIFS